MKLLNRIKNKIKNKVKDNRGESLAEVLVAVLVSSLGMVLLASMISTSVDMVMKSKDRFEQYIEDNNTLVLQDNSNPEEGPHAGKVVIQSSDGRMNSKLTAGSTDSIVATYYVNTIANSKKVFTFSKLEGNNSGSGNGSGGGTDSGSGN